MTADLRDEPKTDRVCICAWSSRYEDKRCPVGPCDPAERKKKGASDDRPA